LTHCPPEGCWADKKSSVNFRAPARPDTPLPLLVYDKDAPEIIIVGFGYPGANPDFGAVRAFDYTPVSGSPDDRDGKRTGHAAEFLRAIETEFIPFIEREYRADKTFRVLGGSSLGGLFTLFAMLERPGLFQGYIAPSPAVAWAEGWLLAREATFATKHKDLPARVFISGASEEDPAQLAAMKRFHGQLQSHHYIGLHARWHLVQGERHAGTSPKATTEACASSSPPSPRVRTTNEELPGGRHC
jgi:predicted alpha/beta superfamily hydrolase